MKYSILIVSLFITFNSFAQTFTYGDSAFYVGAKKAIANLDYSSHRFADKHNRNIIDSLTTFLKSNTSIRIQLINYTGSRGSTAYNLKLSQGRAKSIKAKLVANGIEEKRIIAIGVGESQPLIGESSIMKLSTEEERENAHKKNERTIIKIIEK